LLQHEAADVGLLGQRTETVRSTGRKRLFVCLDSSEARAVPRSGPGAMAADSLI